MVWGWCGDMSVWITQLMWIIHLGRTLHSTFEWSFINVVESSQFLFVLLRLLNLALFPVPTPKTNTSVEVIFPILSNHVTIEATRTMVSKMLVRLGLCNFCPFKSHQDELVALFWLHNPFVLFILSSACKYKESESGFKSNKYLFTNFLFDVLGCVSGVHQVCCHYLLSCSQDTDVKFAFRHSELKAGLGVCSI